MFNTAAIVNLIQNSLIVIALLWLRRWLKCSGIRLSMQQSQGISASLVDKKQFWERVLIDQDIRQASVVINATELSQEVNNTHHSPKNDSIREPWFIQKFFTIYCMTNYCHIFMLARLINKEWRNMLPRDRLNFWQSLMLPLLCYQFIAYLSYQWSIALLLLMPLIAALNLLIHIVTNTTPTGLEQSMNYTCLHISQLHDHFPRESMNDQQLYQNLTRYAFTLQTYQEHTWVFGLFIFSFMLCVCINDIDWLFIFGWMLGALTEQIVRGVVLIVYSKRLAKQWMLNPVEQYIEMSQLATYYNSQLPIIHRSSPKKYVINNNDVDVSCFAKEQSNGMLIHQSTNEVIRKPQVLRVTSSNVGEDTHMDMTIEQDIQIQPTQHQQQSDSNPEGGIFKKKHHRVKLESLYLSKQRSPTEISKRSKSPIEFNPIEILQNLSPIGSLNPSSQREQFPNRWEGEQHNDNIETISNYVSPKGQPLKIISNQIQISNSGMRRNSYKTSKEEEEHSYKENRRIRIQSLSKKRSPQQQQERRKSTNTKVRGESVRGDTVSVKVRGDSVKVRGDSVKVRASSQLKSDIPILNFDSARFKEQQPSQRTQRKNQSNTNKKRIQQILQVYENNQTSNENRS